MVGETERNVRDILAESGGDPEVRSERDEAAAWLREYLIQQGGSAKASDIIKASRADGIAAATLQRARKRAGIATTRQGFGQGSVWTLDL